MSAFGDLKYPAGLQAFRVRRPACAEGRRVLPCRLDPGLQPELPHLQFAQQLHSQRRRRAGHGADLCEPDGRAPRTSPTPCTASRRARCRSRRTGSPIASCCGPRHHVPRRQRAHCPRCRLLAANTQGQGPPDHPAAAARLCRRRGGRRRDRGRAVCAASARATCRCSWRAADFFARLLLRPARSTRRRSRCRSAAAPTRSDVSSPAATSNTTRVKDWWGADLPVARGQNNFDVVRYEYYRDREVALRGFTGKNYLFREEFTSRIWATRYDFPALQDGRVKRDDASPTTRRRARRAGSSIRAARNSRTGALREALIYAFDFEWTNKTIMYGVLQAHPFGVPEFRHDGGGQAGRRRACAARAVPRQGARRGVRRALRAAGFRRLGPGPRAAAQGERSCCSEAGFAIKDGKRVTAEGRAAHDRVPDRRAVVPAAPHAVHQESRHPRHRRDLAHGRSGAVSQARRRLRLRHHGAALRLFHARPGDSLRTYFSSQAASTEGLAQPRRHRRSGDRRADRARSSRPTTARHW